LTDIKMNSIKDAKRLFDPTLFWDAESVDLEQHADYIIARVLDFGDEKDLKTLREIYADEKLIGVVKERRGLLSMTRRFRRANPEELAIRRFRVEHTYSTLQ